MKVPIAYGLSLPDRIVSGATALDFSAMADLSFEAINSRGHDVRFPGLKLAWEVLDAPPGSTAVLNAANEVAVEAFLTKQIRFDQIHAVNLETLSCGLVAAPHSLEDLLALDAHSRDTAPVSYTHLDVYKRQALKRQCMRCQVTDLPHSTSAAASAARGKCAPRYPARSSSAPWRTPRG